MQTPISFALELLLDCETIEEVHKKCRKYIKYLESKESGLHRPQIMMVPNNPGPAIGQMLQAPSTQRLLEQHGLAQVAAPPIVPPAARTIGGEIPTGNGTRGPRKF